jgi:hypothetical protein
MVFDWIISYRIILFCERAFELRFISTGVNASTLRDPSPRKLDVNYKLTKMHLR